MFDEIINLLSSTIYLPIILSIVLFLKVGIFVKYRTRSWRLNHFVYFDANHIRGSRNLQNETAKKIQNFLSQVIITMTVLIIFVELASFVTGS